MAISKEVFEIYGNKRTNIRIRTVQSKNRGTYHIRLLAFLSPNGRSNILLPFLSRKTEIMLMKNMQGMDKVTQIVVMNRELMDAIIVGNITTDQIPVDTTINLGVPIANN